MVGRSSDATLSKYAHIIMGTVHNNNGQYCVMFQVIDQTKISTYHIGCEFFFCSQHMDPEQ